jgi:fructose-1,6-bisphosphatase
MVMKATTVTTHNEEKLETNLITLSRHVLHSQKHHPDASGDLTLLLVSIQVACKFISSQVRRAGLANLYGLELIPNFAERVLLEV